eukprot:5358450-Prymnesium_polylepis.1
MVCFQAAHGNDDAQRAARGKHFVLFDLPADKGALLKLAQPDLGWAADLGADLDGHPALPFSVACRLILQVLAERDEREQGLFAQFPSAQLFNRLWSAIVGYLNIESETIFQEVIVAAAKAPDQNVFVSVAGDWVDVEGDPAGTGLGRWVECITRGDVFAATPGSMAGLAGAEVLYYVGPFMLEEQRDDESHFVVATNTLGK